MSVPRRKRRFQLVLIKPSGYDNEGHVQRARSALPASSLACLYALALDAAERQVLGPNVAIDITAVDEAKTRVREKEIIAQFAQHGGFGMVGLIGVQAHQFPRALDIARLLRAAGLPVLIGGLGIPDCIATKPEMPADLRQALDLGCSVSADETEENGRIDELIRDAANGTLRPVYDHLDDLPPFESTPTPFMPSEMLKRTIDHYASFDADRGCPFQCSLCTGVQRQKSLRRSPDDVEQLVRAHHSEAIRWFFLPEDDFAANEEWEAILDRIILLRERNRIELKIVIQVSPLSYKTPNFVAKAARAGVRKVFIGLENINPTALATDKKGQKKTPEYNDAILTWKNSGVTPYAGSIGFPEDPSHPIHDTESDKKKEPPSNIADFFCFAATSAKVRSAVPLRIKRPRR